MIEPDSGPISMGQLEICVQRAEETLVFIAGMILSVSGLMVGLTSSLTRSRVSFHFLAPSR